MSNRNSNKQGVIKRDVNAAERASLAVQLRAQKLTFDEIAKKCGYASPGACRNAIMRELNRTMVKNVEELRLEELRSLELLEAECWKRFYDKEYEKSALFAVDRINAIKERRARLMGLDQPTSGNIAAAQIIIREYGVEVDKV